MEFDNKIFFRPVGDHFGLPAENISLVYAPLANLCFLAKPEECRRIRAALEAKAENRPLPADDEVNTAFVETLTARVSKFLPIPASPRDLVEIDILANNTCNFRCAYCYSAFGRTNQHNSFENITPLIDFLFNGKGADAPPLRINFSGGGEPLIDFPLIRRIVEYIEAKAARYPRRFQFGLVSNGSLITAEIADFAREHRIDLAISFEIIREFQNAERGQYDKVAAALDLLIARNVPFGIRTNLTPTSVLYMEEMVEELHRRFPGIRSVTFEPILSAAFFPTPESLESYYNDFYDHYLKAHAKANAYGLPAGSTAFTQTQLLRERRCIGKIVLTPDGAISHCARISSPKESLYNEFIIGRIDEAGRVQMDEEHYARLMRHNIHNLPECSACFARWNCGGACYLFDCTFPADFKKAYCHFTRKCLSRELLDLLERQHRQNHSQPFAEYIRSQFS